MSYCFVENSDCYDYDIITDDIRNINTALLKQGLENRIKRLTTEQLRVVQKERNCTPKQALEFVDQAVLDSFTTHTLQQVIVRIMTDEHIPREEDDDTKAIRTNFKPYKHYQLHDKGHVDEVARSHWKGSIERGEFSMTHGKLTNELGKMFIVLCDKIGMRSNYRGYSFLDEMKGDARFQLTKNALLFDESRITVQLNPFAYYTTIVNHAFKAVLNAEKKSRDLRDDLLEQSGYDPSSTRIVEYEMAMVKDYQEKLTNAALGPITNSHPTLVDFDDWEDDPSDLDIEGDE